MLNILKVNAGAPFITDDPEPVEFRHYEIYLFANLSDTDISIEEPFLNAPAIEINYGILPDTHLHMIVPYSWATPTIDSPRGLGDIELGIEYRFLDETEQRPQIAIYPQIELPIGNANRNLGNGRLWGRLPIWIQKSWGPWTSYGGGGWAFNSEPGMKNYPFAGWQVQRDLSKKLTLGIELFSEGAVSEIGSSSTIMNAGGYYRFSKHFFMLFSAGHSIIGQDRTVAYFSLYWTNGPDITY
jgi:hypothetical protein